MTTTTTVRELRELEGAPVYDRDDSKIGVVEEIFTDDRTDRPQFIGIGTGFLRMNRALVPIESANITDGGIRVPYEKSTVKDSPDVTGEVIEPGEARALYDHYGLTGPIETREGTHTEPRGHLPGTDTPTTERTAAEKAEVTRHEEDVHVGKRDVDAGSVRLRKWIETDRVDTDVEVEREHADVRRERVDQPASRTELGEKEVEVPLREQEPVVQKDVRAKERVEVDKAVERDREPVSETVRKERVEVEDETR